VYILHRVAQWHPDTLLDASQPRGSFPFSPVGTVAVSQPRANVVLDYTGSLGGNEQVSPISLRKLFVLLYYQGEKAHV